MVNNDSFTVDPHPGRPRILFIGLVESSHTRSWIDLLDDAKLNVRLFALPSGVPPVEWKVKTYVTHPHGHEFGNSSTRHTFRGLIPIAHSIPDLCNRAARLLRLRTPTLESTLAHVIRNWQPHVIHTLGLEPASYLYYRTRQEPSFRFQGNCTWVAQVRGGPDLVMNRHLPEYRNQIQDVLHHCDQLIADNQQNYDLMRDLGVAESQLSSLGVVSGTGGIDVAGLSKRWPGLPSQRERVIVWPKVYEAPSAKALPVLEGLRQVWPAIRPCRIHMLWVHQPELRICLSQLPPEIQASCTVADRLPRTAALNLFLRARVMLAPSLTDGIPNSMLEAMACGAFPIVSPIETLAPLLKSPENVLFARNLYPTEIARALEIAMNNDEMVDAAAENNLAFVYAAANRETVRQRVVAYYEGLAAGKQEKRAA